LSKETFGADTFDIDRALPSLLTYGYVKLKDRNPAEITYERIQRPDTNKICILETSSELREYQHISKLMQDLFPYESSATFKFFYLYQIFEILIEAVYKLEQEEFADRLNEVRHNSGKAKNVFEKYNNILKDKKRLELL